MTTLLFCLMFARIDHSLIPCRNHVLLTSTTPALPGAKDTGTQPATISVDVSAVVAPKSAAPSQGASRCANGKCSTAPTYTPRFIRRR